MRLLDATRTVALLSAIAVLGIADYVTGPYGFSLFYLIPIALGAWYVGVRTGVALGGVAAFTWLVVELADTSPDHVLPSTWNGFTRLVIFTSVALLLAVLRQRERQSAELERFQGRLLELVDRELPDRLDRLRRSTMSGRSGRDARAASEITTAVDDLVLLTNRVVALSLVASGSSRGGADVSAVIKECVRVAGDRDRVVVGQLPPARAKVSSRLLRFLVAGLIISALRTTAGYVRLSLRAEADHVLITLVIDRATTPIAERNVAELLIAITTAREVLERAGDSVGVDESDDATTIELRLRSA